MTVLTYPDYGQLAHITKEAVASAILHRTYNMLRGAGPEGRVIYREKPAKVLHTQFLLPRRKLSATAISYLEKDDVSSPAHIGTVGLSFQIANWRDKTISVHVRACIYVRILPSTADLIARPVVFRLSKQARSIILRHLRDALRRAEEENEAILGVEGRKSAAWLAIKNSASDAAENDALVEMGISLSSLSGIERREAVVSVLPEQDELPADDDPSVSLELGAHHITASDVVADVADPAGTAIDERRPAGAHDSAPTGDSDTLKIFEFVVKPGGSNAPPEILIEREHIPQKWLRIPVNFGTLVIDLSRDAAFIDTCIADFNAHMRHRLEEVIDAWEKDPDPQFGGVQWAFPAGSGTRSRMITPAEVIAWDQTLTTLRANRQRVARPQIMPVLEFENLEDPLRREQRTIRIILANESDLTAPDKAEGRECDASLYQVELAVELSPGLHCPISLERIAPSYRYNQYLTHDALGINCGVRRKRLVETNILETTALPVYFQPLIQQFEISAPPKFSKLGEKYGGLDILESLLAAYDDWLASVIASKPFESALDPIRDAADYAREKQQFETVDLPRWQAERRAVARGIRTIEQAVRAQELGKGPTDPEVIPLTAWRFMNQTFQEFWTRKNKSVTEWRLFQIAFIVAQIAALASRLDHLMDDALAFSDQDDREATLLYFSTGGGKSESFFGLLIYALAFDRLRGKERGITAVVRYPLRLLTSQQASRLSQVLAAAQRVRWAWKEQNVDLFGHPFEIGFWVGGNNTPNNPNVRGVSQIPRLHQGWNELSLRRGEYRLYLKKWSRLPKCPFCDGTLQADNGKKYSTIGLRRLPDGPDERLAHLCFNPKCDWNQKHGAMTAPHPLPIHIMDSDIYAYTPSVLLGTVDKLALIGHSSRTISRVLGMFGFPAWHHVRSGRLFSPNTREQFRKGPQGYGCEPVFPFYEDGKKLFFDPYPLLEIQDEAHLVDESLGTFSGLFETTFHHALRTLAPLLKDQVVTEGGRARPPRIVAASATVSEPSRQIDQIYQRQVVLFPQPGPDLYESFYARLQRPNSGDPTRDASDNAEHRTPTRRRYISLMTNGRTHTAATVAVLSAFHLTITQVFKTLVEGNDADRWALRRELADVLPSDIFRQGHRNVLLDPDVPHAHIAYAIDLDRIALLYVTNKKGGDNVKAALQDVIRRDHRLAGFRYTRCKDRTDYGRDRRRIDRLHCYRSSVRAAGGDAF